MSVDCIHVMIPQALDYMLRRKEKEVAATVMLVLCKVRSCVTDRHRSLERSVGIRAENFQGYYLSL